jgi:malate dehydrogenase (oxaloacetate-decarboxylating)(NADP+)
VSSWTSAELDEGLIYPPQATLFKTALYAAECVAEIIFARSLADIPIPADIGQFVRSQTYKAEYRPLT